MLDLIPDSLLINEYSFTFLVTFLSVSIKGLSNKSESVLNVFKDEAYDFGPELVFIAISFAVSRYAQLYESGADITQLTILKTVIVHMLILVFLIVFLRRLSYTKEGKPGLVKGLIIPLFMGFVSLFVVLTYTSF
ncbi:MAG: hypothetical protein ACK40G_00055 [Cytophagaceae bacterium]